MGYTAGVVPALLWVQRKEGTVTYYVPVAGESALKRVKRILNFEF